MGCRSPRTAYYKPGGGITFGRGESFGPAWAYVLDCGVCIDCRLRRKRDWAIRACCESQMHERGCIVTLTYAEDPGSLIRRDTQIFFKNLRNAGYKFRYFGCGEYGEKLSRPHYHICLFGIDFLEDRYPWRRKGPREYYRSKNLESAWRHGFAEIGKLSVEGAMYCAEYVTKKIIGEKAERHYSREFNGVEYEVAPEMLLASRKPGLGESWIKKFWRDVYPCDSVVMQGREYRPPKYFDEWCKSNKPDVWKEVVRKRAKELASKEPESALREAQKACAGDNRRAFNKRRDYEESDTDRRTTSVVETIGGLNTRGSGKDFYGKVER